MTAERDTDAAAVPKQSDPRYERLMEATRAAARRGYEAVSMRELAETCRLSMTTIYQFCRSKDQLIAEAHAGNMVAFRSRLAERPPKGATPAERVRRVLRSMTRPLEDDPVLTRTLMRAAYSLDPAVGEARASVGSAYTDMIDAAIGPVEIAHREAVIGTLGMVVDSVILGWLSGRHDVDWVRARLDDAVDALLSSAASDD